MSELRVQIEAMHAGAEGGESPRAQAVRAMFQSPRGEGSERRKGNARDPGLLILEGTEVPIRTGEVVFITGPSGGGKSTLVRRIADAAADAGWRVVDVDGGAVSGRLAGGADHEKGAEACRALAGEGGEARATRRVIDCVDGPGRRLAGMMATLARAGLAEAGVMVRPVDRLSVGERYRLRLAAAMEVMEWPEAGSSLDGAIGEVKHRPGLLVADEFGSALDRANARSIARMIGRWARRRGHCLLAATAHDDLLEALRPEVLVHAGLGGRTAVREMGRQDA